MNLIEELQHHLSQRFPKATVEMDAPDDPSNRWFLDVTFDADSPRIVVDWKPGSLFGVSTPGPDDYSSKPDEVYSSLTETHDRVVRLILSKSTTERLRATEARDCLAAQPMRGPTIDPISDPTLGPLLREVAILGGRVSIQIDFAKPTPG